MVWSTNRRLRVLVVLMLVTAGAAYVGFVATPRAAALDVGSLPWASATDSDLARFVTSPFSPQTWGGDGSSLDSVYNLIANGYNGANVENVLGAVERVAEATAVEEAPLTPLWINPVIALTVTGAIIAYETRGLWYEWLSNEWAAPDTSNTILCGNVGASGSSCSPQPVRAGQRVCLGYQSPATSLQFWVAPSDGFVLTTKKRVAGTPTTSNWCGTGAIPVSMGDPLTTANMGLATAAAQTVGPARQTDTGIRWGCMSSIDHQYRPGDPQVCTDFQVWFQPTPLPANTNGPGNAGFGGAPHAVEVYTGDGLTQPIPAGHHTPATTPTDADVANALRQQLTAPGDTCGGLACPWGDNGGDPDAANTATNSDVFSCVIAGGCAITPLVPSFTMPNCYGLTASACLSEMQNLGFTGTLNQNTSPIDQLDITQPAGAILSTSPATGSPVSKLADAVANDYENPQGCKWDVQNPHESVGSPGLIDVKATATCTYETTVVGSLRLWKCDEQPSPDLVQLEAGAWGCVETPGTLSGESRLAQPKVPVTFQVPPPGSGIEILPGGKYFIAFGTLDKGSRRLRSRTLPAPSTSGQQEAGS